MRHRSTLPVRGPCPTVDLMSRRGLRIHDSRPGHLTTIVRGGPKGSIPKGMRARRGRPVRGDAPRPSGRPVGTTSGRIWGLVDEATVAVGPLDSLRMDPRARRARRSEPTQVRREEAHALLQVQPLDHLARGGDRQALQGRQAEARHDRGRIIIPDFRPAGGEGTGFSSSLAPREDAGGRTPGCFNKPRTPPRAELKFISIIVFITEYHSRLAGQPGLSGQHQPMARNRPMPVP
jgi:hypothetical protein